MECLCATAVLAMVAAVAIARSNIQAELHQVQCVRQLKEVGLAFRQFANDNGDRFPMAVSRRLGGAREGAQTGDLTAIYSSLAHYQSDASLVLCPGDSRRAAESMASMVTSNLSYFVNLGAGNDGSTAVLLGDRDLKRELPGGSPDGLLTGVREFGDRDSGRDLVWGRKQHRPAGNMAFADGTVRRVVNAELPSAIANPNAPAARLLFPQ